MKKQIKEMIGISLLLTGKTGRVSNVCFLSLNLDKLNKRFSANSSFNCLKRDFMFPGKEICGHC